MSVKYRSHLMGAEVTQSIFFFNNLTSKVVESSSVPVCKAGSVFVVLSSSGH